MSDKHEDLWEEYRKGPPLVSLNRRRRQTNQDRVLENSTSAAFLETRKCLTTTSKLADPSRRRLFMQFDRNTDPLIIAKEAYRQWLDADMPGNETDVVEVAKIAVMLTIKEFQEKLNEIGISLKLPEKKE